MKVAYYQTKPQDSQRSNTQGTSVRPTAQPNQKDNIHTLSAAQQTTSQSQYNYEKELKSKFPGAQVEVADLSDPQELKRYAQSHFGSLKIVLSPEALKRLETDAEFRKKCETLISETRKTLYDQAAHLGSSGRLVLGVGMYIDEDGNVSKWTASKEKPQPNIGPGMGTAGSGNQTGQGTYFPWFTSTSRTKDGTISRFQGKDGNQYVIKKSLSYRPSKDLSKLAKARNQQMVKSTISSIRASIYQLKSGGGDKKVSKQLVNQAEQVILKAQIKIKHLKKEALLEGAQKEAEEQSELKRAMMLKRMLEEKKVKRTVREYGQIRDHYPTPQEIKQEEEKVREWVESITGVSSASVNADVIQTYTPAGAAVSSPGITSGGGGSGVFVDITL